jgi:polar amino acid transport system substrate-binding protein
MTTMTSTRRLALLAFASAALVAGCGKAPDTKPAAPAAPAPAAAASAPAPAAKVYVVGTDAAYAPFESQAPGGEIVGFDIDVVKAAAAKAGFEVKFVNTPWEGIFKTLDTGERDMVVSAVTITDERKLTMDFSLPYFNANQLIAVKDNSKVAKFDDLKTLKVGVQTGTTGDEVVQKLLGKTSANIKRFESTPLALKELEAGGVNAVVADNGVVQHYIQNNPAAKFKSVSDASFTPEQYGVAMKRGNTELQKKINDGLAAIQADGSYEAIHVKYFGVKPAAGAVAPNTTAAPAAAVSAPAAAASK